MKYFPIIKALREFLDSQHILNDHPMLRLLAITGIVAIVTAIGERLLRRTASRESSEGQAKDLLVTEPDSSSVINADALRSAVGEAPTTQWYVKLVSGEQFGPADGRAILGWIAEARVTKGDHVWREDWNAWKMFEG